MSNENTEPTSLKPRILVIEDEAILKKAIVLSLKKSGYETMEASNAQEARKIFKSTSVNIILLDIGLPDCNGLDLLEEIRKLDPGLSVIVMTAQDTVENLDRTKKLGASGLFVKPIILKQLKKMIQVLVQAPVQEEKGIFQSVIRAKLNSLGY